MKILVPDITRQLKAHLEAKKGYRQWPNPNQKWSSSYKSPGILYDGHYIEFPENFSYKKDQIYDPE